MSMFILGIFAFAAILVPLAARRYWMVLLTGLVCWGLTTFIYWNALTADPSAHPTFAHMALPALKDAAVYTVFATVLYFIKRLFVSSAPRKPSNID